MWGDVVRTRHFGPATTCTREGQYNVAILALYPRHLAPTTVKLTCLDLSVVGYDDSTLVAFTDPPLTTVRQSVQAMGEAGVRALLDEIAGEPAPRAEYVFRPELVVRGSCGCNPAQRRGPRVRARARSARLARRRPCVRP